VRTRNIPYVWVDDSNQMTPRAKWGQTQLAQIFVFDAEGVIVRLPSLKCYPVLYTPCYVVAGVADTTGSYM